MPYDDESRKILAKYGINAQGQEPQAPQYDEESRQILSKYGLDSGQPASQPLRVPGAEAREQRREWETGRIRRENARADYRAAREEAASLAVRDRENSAYASMQKDRQLREQHEAKLAEEKRKAEEEAASLAARDRENSAYRSMRRDNELHEQAERRRNDRRSQEEKDAATQILSQSSAFPQPPMLPKAPAQPASSPLNVKDNPLFWSVYPNAERRAETEQRSAAREAAGKQAASAPANAWDSMTRGEQTTARLEAEAAGQRARKTGGNRTTNVAVPDDFNSPTAVEFLGQDERLYQAGVAQGEALKRFAPETQDVYSQYKYALDEQEEAQRRVGDMMSFSYPEGSPLAQAQAQEQAEAQAALEAANAKVASFDGKLSAAERKGVENMRSHPLITTALAALQQGAAGLSYSVSGAANAVFGKDGVVGWLLQEGGGMFGDGINNLLQANVIDADYIRSGDWNPITKFHQGQLTPAYQDVMEKSVQSMNHDPTAMAAAEIGAGVVQMLPQFILMALTAGTSSVASTASLGYQAALNTASSPIEKASVVFSNSLRSLLGNPAAKATFTQEFGSSYNEAVNDGAGNGTAIIYAALNAAVNTSIEYAGGVETAAFDTSRKGLLGLAQTLLEELDEEELQRIFGKSLKSAYQDVKLYSTEDPNAVINPREMWDTAVNTAIGTLLQVPVQKGIFRVAGGVQAAQQRAQDGRVLRQMENAAAMDEQGNTDANTISALEEIAKDSRLANAFRDIYGISADNVLKDFQAENPQAGATAAQNATGAQQVPVQAETAPVPAEAPTEAQAQLNSQETQEQKPYSAVDALTGVEPRAQGAQEGAGAQENAQSGSSPSQSLRDSSPQSGASQEGGVQALADAATGRAPEITARPEKKTAKPDTVTNATKKLQEKFGEGLRLQETRGRVQSLAAQARETDAGDPGQVRSLWESAKQQAREILRTTENPSARTGGGTGSEIRDYLRRQKIRIDERLRSDRPSEYESLQELRRKNFGTLVFSNTEGRTLDQVYQELGYMFGEGLFPQDAMGHADMVERILGAVANERGKGYTYEQSLTEGEYEHAVADLTMDLMQAAESVTGQSIPTPVRETQQSMTAEQEREAAIESELEADFEGELSREDAERIVDQRFEDYGEYDLDKILNGMEDAYGEDGEQTEEFDEYAYWAERFHAEEGEGAVEGADAGSETQLPETVGQGTPAGGPAEAEPGGAGEVRGPGSAAPDGEVSGEDGESGPPGASAPTETEGRRAAEGSFEELGERYGGNGGTGGGPGLPPGGQTGNGPGPGRKLSRFWTNTLQQAESDAAIPGDVSQPLWYLPKSQVRSLAEGASMLSEDKQGTVESLVQAEAWSSRQQAAAAMIADEMVVNSRKTGDWSAYAAWREVMQNHITETARGLQFVSRYTRHTGMAALDSAIKNMHGSKLSQQAQNHVISEVANFATELDGIGDGDTASLKDLIKRMAKRRGNWTIIRGNMEKMLDKQSESWLREAAYRQLEAMPRDAMNRGAQNLAAKVASYRVLSMLSGLPTIGRNLEGNTIFGLIDLFSAQGPGRAIDAMLGNLTGQRTVVGSRAGVWKTAPEWFKNAWELCERSMLETALDIDTDPDSSKPYNMPASSTFIADSNGLEKMFQRWSQIMSYALTSSDRFYRGGIQGGELANYQAFDEKRAGKGKKGTGLTAEEQAGLSRETADYRLFQNKTGITEFEKKVRKAADNWIGWGGEKDADGKRIKDNTFGVGSLLMPFVEVPTNLALKTAEYGPGNLAKAAADLVKLAKLTHENKLAGPENRVSTAKLQQKVSMEAARGLTGTAMLILCTALAKLGLIRNADDEDDYDVSAAEKTTGEKGTQFNLSAAQRALTGGSTDWQEGDVLVGFSGISPLDMWLNAGARFADLDAAENGAEWVGSRGNAYFQAAVGSILDIPVFQQMAEFTNVLRNADEFTWETFGDVVGSLIDSNASSFIPQPIRNAARAADPYVRDTAGDSWLEDRKNNFLQYLPFGRQSLPAKVDSFGNPSGQPGTPAQRWINGLLSPNPVSTYRQNSVIDMLAGLREESGKASFYPNRKPPKSVELMAEDGSGKEPVELTAEQSRAYQSTYGQTYTQILQGWADSEDFSGMSLKDRRSLLSDAESFSGDLAKRQLAESLGREYSSDWDKMYSVIQTGVDPADYLLGKKNADADGNGNLNGREVFDWLWDSGYSDEGKAAAWDANKGNSDKTWAEYEALSPVKILAEFGIDSRKAKAIADEINVSVNPEAKPWSTVDSLSEKDFIAWYKEHPDQEEAVRALFDAKDSTEKTWADVSAAWEGLEGGDIKDYLDTKDAFGQAVKDGDYSAIDALLGDMDSHSEAVAGKLDEKVTRLEDRREAYAAGIDSETWSAAYEEYKRINEMDLKANDKAIELDKYLRSVDGLSTEQRELLRNQLRYYNIMSADPGRYDKMTAAGMSPENADRVYDAVSALEPLPGAKSVSTSQTVQAIDGLDLTEQEKWEAYKVYAPSDKARQEAEEAQKAGKRWWLFADQQIREDKAFEDVVIRASEKVGAETYAAFAEDMRGLNGSTDPTGKARFDSIHKLGLDAKDEDAMVKQYMSGSYWKSYQALRGTGRSPADADRILRLVDRDAGKKGANGSVNGFGISQSDIYEYARKNPSDGKTAEALWAAGGWDGSWADYKAKEDKKPENILASYGVANAGTVWKSVDANGNNSVDQKEFFASVKQHPEISEDAWKAVFASKWPKSDFEKKKKEYS